VQKAAPFVLVPFGTATITPKLLEDVPHQCWSWEFGDYGDCSRNLKAKSVGIGIAIAIAIGRIGLRKPIAIGIAMPIPIAMIASRRELSLFMRRRARPGAWATDPKFRAVTDGHLTADGLESRTPCSRIPSAWLLKV
jgi:hypothetical protein